MSDFNRIKQEHKKSLKPKNIKSVKKEVDSGLPPCNTSTSSNKNHANLLLELKDTIKIKYSYIQSLLIASCYYTLYSIPTLNDVVNDIIFIDTDKYKELPIIIDINNNVYICIDINIIINKDIINYMSKDFINIIKCYMGTHNKKYDIFLIYIHKSIENKITINKIL